MLQFQDRDLSQEEAQIRMAAVFKLAKLLTTLHELFDGLFVFRAV